MSTKQRSRVYQRFITLSFIFMSSSLFASQLPVELSCSGTEPFWGLTLKNDQALLNMGEHNFPLEIESVTGFAGQSFNPGFTASVRANGKSGKLFIVAGPQCSDGMSDRVYSHYVIYDDGDLPFYGCCLIPKRRR